MDDILEPQDLAETLQEAMRDGASLDMEYVTVSIRIPQKSVRRWIDDRGIERVTHLPTAAFAHPAEFAPGEDSDHSSAATFVLHTNAAVPDPTVCLELADELDSRSMAWGDALYGELGLPLDIAELPVVLEPLARHALESEPG